MLAEHGRQNLRRKKAISEADVFHVKIEERISKYNEDDTTASFNFNVGPNQHALRPLISTSNVQTLGVRK